MILPSRPLKKQRNLVSYGKFESLLAEVKLDSGRGSVCHI